MAFFVEGLTGFGGIDGRARCIGEYDTLAGALAAARRTIDEFLVREFRSGMLPSALFAKYEDSGEAPFIFRNYDETVDVPDFNHVRYALARCKEICGRRRVSNR